MVTWPTPTNQKQLRGFLALTEYYRRFVARYAMIAAPLTDLLKKETFLWMEESTKSFEALPQFFKDPLSNRRWQLNAPNSQMSNYKNNIRKLLHKTFAKTK